MSRVLPILFNTEMVQAILAGRKSCTRRIAKGVYPFSEYGDFTTVIRGEWTGPISEENIIKLKSRYKTGDILYVRETWSWHNDNEKKKYIYRTDYCDENKSGYWKPSIHMPKEAARIWLKVTGVRVAKLQDINGRDVLKEGLNSLVHPDAFYFDMNQLDMFEQLWNSTIKKTELEQFGWDANPYVWVIEFERCDKPTE